MSAPALSPTLSWMLLVRPPRGGERVIQLDRPVLHVGSAADCDVVLDENFGVSAHHCTLKLSGGKYILLDRRSKNGTFINSAPCTEPTTLHDGDKIAVGTCVMELRAKAPPPVSAPPAVDLKAPVPLTIPTAAPTRPRASPLRRLLAFWVAVLGVSTWLIVSPRREVMAPPKPPGKDETTGATGDDLSTHPAKALPPPENPPEIEHERKWIWHERIPGETLLDVAALYDVSLAELQLWNKSARSEPAPGTRLRLKTTRSTIKRQIETYTVKQGDSWESISIDLGVEEEDLKKYNPDVRRPRAGDILSFWVDIEPFGARSSENIPIFRLPKSSVVYQDGAEPWIENAVQLVPSNWCDVRCAAHAYGTDHTLTKLLEALATFRNVARYKGQIMIGDISRIHGGKYGPHLSHQSGRDVDIWLLPRGGVYRKGCPNCSTDACRPEPDTEVDWDRTWRFIQVLDALRTTNSRGKEIPAVEVIFLSTPQQKQLFEAATRAGAGADELKRIIQYPRSRTPTLVQDWKGHVHHIHVRFCDPEGLACG